MEYNRTIIRRITNDGDLCKITIKKFSDGTTVIFKLTFVDVLKCDFIDILNDHSGVNLIKKYKNYNLYQEFIALKKDTLQFINDL